MYQILNIIYLYMCMYVYNIFYFLIIYIIWKVLQVAQGGQPIMVQGIPQGHTIQIQSQPGQQVQQVNFIFFILTVT